MKRRGVEARIVLANGTVQLSWPDRGLINLIARAHLYIDQLTDGSNVTLSDVASNYGTDAVEVSRILPLAYLAPRIVHAIMMGEQPAELTVQRLSRMSDFPVAWRDKIDSLRPMIFAVFSLQSDLALPPARTTSAIEGASAGKSRLHQGDSRTITLPNTWKRKSADGDARPGWRQNSRI